MIRLDDCTCNHPEAMRALLDSGGVSDRSSDIPAYALDQALALASVNDRAITARYSIERGANVNGLGGLPMEEACRFASQNYVQLLLGRGADVDGNERVAKAFTDYVMSPAFSAPRAPDATETSGTEGMAA